MNFRNLLIITIFVLVFSCTDNDTPGGDLFSQQAILFQKNNGTEKQAQFSEIHKILAAEEDEGTQKEVNYFVNLAKENTENIKVELNLSEEEVAKYNATYGTAFPVLTDKYIEYDAYLNIEAGKVNSNIGKLKITAAADLKDNTPYMIALTLTSTSNGTNILKSSQTLFYTFEKAKGVIKKTAILKRNLYFTLANYASVNDIGETFTMEGLVYVDKFRGPGDGGDAGITTFMGTEGQTLMRFGDAGVPPNHLQANGQDIGFTFETKKWYHIALVVENNKTTAYVNGKKITNFSKSGSLSDFFIGKSYNDNRGLPGKVSEIRLWKTARSATDIAENMYGVSPKTSGLYAYWKMNEVKNNKIQDVSGNGKDLILQGQSELSGRQDIKLSDEKDGVSVE